MSLKPYTATVTGAPAGAGKVFSSLTAFSVTLADVGSSCEPIGLTALAQPASAAMIVMIVANFTNVISTP
jgi:hypothetical protein